jgi:hypothetical protein
MNRSEFIDLIDQGSDIMFVLNGKGYSIIGNAPGGPNIAEQMTEENEGTFKNGNDLLQNYQIAGRPLDEYFEGINITHST